MRFSWKAIILAPLPVPLIASLVLAMAPSQSRFQAFLFFFALGCVFSYGVSLALFLPSLFVLSRFTRLTAWLTGLVGMLLGMAVYLPVGWQSYLITGDNSGPPTGSFAHYLWHNSWSESWLFYLGGLLTATVYWLLAKRLGPLVTCYLGKSLSSIVLLSLVSAQAICPSARRYGFASSSRPPCCHNCSRRRALARRAAGVNSVKLHTNSNSLICEIAEWKM